MKKTVFLLINMTFFLILSTPVFSAGLDGCKIERVGTDSSWENIDLHRGKHAIYLSHPTAWVGNRYFFLSSNLGAEGLATFLTALALEKTVFIKVESSGMTEGSIISTVYANNW